MLQFLARRKKASPAPMPPPPPGRRLVFVHLPRTGGSNVWHSTAVSLQNEEESIGFLDLHHESQIRFGTIHNTSDCVAALNQELSSDIRDLFIHHHSAFGVWRLLDPSAVYFTLLRDPVDRYISNYFHYLQLYYDIDQQCLTYRLKSRFAEALHEQGLRIQRMRDKPTRSLPQQAASPWMPDDVLRRYLMLEQEGFNLLTSEAVAEYLNYASNLKNYYVDFLTSYFLLDVEIGEDGFLPMAYDGDYVADLAQVVRQRFAEVFFSVSDALTFVASYFSRNLDCQDECRNAAFRPPLANVATLHKTLRASFRWDYELIAKLQDL